MFVTALHRRKHAIPWVHKWDCTAVSGGSIPDLIGGISMTLAGGYTSSASGVRLTAASGIATVPKSSLSIDLSHGNSSTYTILIAVSDTYSTGVGAASGRYFDCQVGSDEGYRGIRFWVSSSTSVGYQIESSSSISSQTVPNLFGKASAVSVNSDAVGKFWVDGSSIITKSDIEYEVSTNDVNVMNRTNLDRPLDAMVVGIGITNKVLTNKEYLDAIAELLAL